MTSDARYARRGLSLIEIIVAAFLLVIVGLIAWALFRSSISASSYGHLQVQLQENARTAMDAVQAELRMAVKPPRIGTARQYPSGVLFPSIVDQDSSHVNAIQGADRQRLIFLEVQNLGTLNQANLGNYTIVEYRVLGGIDNVGGAGGKARLVRRTWPAQDSLNTQTYIRGLSFGTDFSCDPEAAGSFDDGDFTVPEKIIVELPFDNDRIRMSIYHQESPTGSSHYDNKVFRIHLFISQTLNNDPNRRKDITLESQVNIQ